MTSMAAHPHPNDAELRAEDADEAAGRLRSAMLEDGQPAFPWWLPLPGVLLALLWAAYQGVSAEDGAGAAFFSTLLWPGAAIFVLTTVTSYFGWRLDLD
jgi:hypothetical protein